MPRPYASSQEFFDDVRDLAARLDDAGLTAAAAELRDGFALLNGLTDGWAMLLDAIVHARGLCHGQPVLAARLDDMEEDVYRTVHRRPMPPWTRIWRRWRQHFERRP